MWGAITVSAFFVFFSIFLSTQPESYCAEQTKVKEILSIQYRSATIKLENGETRTVNQATLKPGDAFCARYATRPK